MTPIDAELLRKKIRERLNDKADHIAGGGCTDFADYRSQAGIIEGLAIAERELLNLIEVQKKLEGDEE